MPLPSLPPNHLKILTCPSYVVGTGRAPIVFSCICQSIHISQSSLRNKLITILFRVALEAFQLFVYLITINVICLNFETEGAFTFDVQTRGGQIILKGLILVFFPYHLMAVINL